MYIPKKYGESRVDKCPFCGRQSICTNKQGIPVCANHKDSKLGEMRCICGGHADMMTGKFGIFFNCLNCGTMNARKIFEINKVEDVNPKTSEQKKVERKAPREITVRSDDPRYFS
ncbi:MAG TPA: hypothetical protein VFF28_05535 [Candidatus Nanoarchaeia archaeon]|nr:hypothetical protein [Candidatus Nanoarchaeia archaeon]